MRDLTPRQKEVLQLVYDIIDETGMPPTRAEIARRLGFKSANAAEEHLKALQKKGALELIPGASRGIRLKDAVNDGMREEQGLPLVGRVAAGSPILAQEHIEGRFQVDPALFHPQPHYLLQVHGMSMKDVGIFSGDLVAVHRTPDVRHNQIVVARLEDEVTVKRYRQKGKEVWLIPENPDFDPIKVDLEFESLVIEGIVVGVIRRDH
ncbi:MAG: transcriptional repressor LexA [Gammaproteobacteria bacterium]|nr:transcriptional repressor LexA [Gammaproteobacteria bacterium]